jgi:hypothetical protein
MLQICHFSGNPTDIYASNLSFFLADVAAVDLSKS